MGEIWAQYQYLIRWKESMMTLTFNFYRVGNEWQLIGITPAGDNNASYLRTPFGTRKPGKRRSHRTRG